MTTSVAANTKGQRILLWTVPPAGALFALAYFLFPVFSPPLSPTMTPEQVAAFFAENVTGILGVAILGNLIAWHLYTQADLARNANQHQSWQDMLLPPKGQ